MVPRYRLRWPGPRWVNRLVNGSDSRKPNSTCTPSPAARNPCRSAATLGPGAINLLLGTADATTNSTPLLALSAQVGMDRSFKESHQGVDLVSMFVPVTKWSALAATPGAVPEILRKAFKLAQTERPGAVYVAIPEDVEQARAQGAPLPVNVPRPDEPSPGQVERAAALLRA